MAPQDKKMLRYNNIVTTAVLAAAITILTLQYNQGKELSVAATRLDNLENIVSSNTIQIAQVSLSQSDLTGRVNEHEHILEILEALLPNKDQFKIKR